MYKAYSLLTVKSVDDDRRLIRGIATTPTPDRSGDIVDPLGAQFPASMPLLLHHDPKLPVGTAAFNPPTKHGIEFQAEFPVVDTPGIVRDRVNEAWDSVKAGLILGVSIGFRAIGDSIEQIKGGGLRFLKTEILELSLVTIPANAEATLAVVKSLDLAASGHHTPGVTGSSTRSHGVKAVHAMTIQEQITQFENTRAAKAAARDALMTTAAETGETLNESQSEQYDGLDREVKNVDAHLTRLHALEQSTAQQAKPVTPPATAAQGSELRGGGSIITVKSQVPKGTAFTRMVMATARAKGDHMLAIEFAKQWKDSTPEVELYMKAAVAAGTTTGATWALPLVPAAQNLTGEFLELLRPKTLLGKMNLRKVPFNVSVPSQTAGGTYGWVGEGKPKPVTSLAFASVTLTQAKIAGIVVLTDELVRNSSPSAEETVKNDMIAGVAAFMDAQFLDPAVAAVANVNPASVTNGIAAIVSAGVTADFAKTDIKALVSSFVAANLSLENAILIMSEANAFALGVAVNPLGQPMFPGFGASGGTIMGIPVITSQAAGTMVILVDQRGILYADEGGTTIDVSREASLQMDGAPDAPATATTVYASLWQLNMVGLRVERHCTWMRARTASVKWTSGAAYT